MATEAEIVRGFVQAFCRGGGRNFADLCYVTRAEIARHRAEHGGPDGSLPASLDDLEPAVLLTQGQLATILDAL
jgi:hypothetical protein